MDLEILKIASDTINHKKLDDCTHKSKQKNPICGDEMEVGVKILENQILDFAYQCKSCIYCQASASVLSKFSINNTINNINEIITFVDVFFESNNAKFPKEWKKLEILFNKKIFLEKNVFCYHLKPLQKH